MPLKNYGVLKGTVVQSKIGKGKHLIIKFIYKAKQGLIIVLQLT